MHPLRIEPTSDTPQIVLDAEENSFQIMGRSLPEDPMAFYTPVIEWIEEYSNEVEAGGKKLKLEVKYEYFNTASSKLFLDVLDILEEMHADGKPVEVIWFYTKGDEDMMESGEGYKELVDVPFELREF